MIIYNAEIYTMESEPISNGYVIFDKEKIQKVGSGDGWKSTVAANAIDGLSTGDAADESIDAKGARLYPGFIDAHSHIGLFDDGIEMLP